MAGSERAPDRIAVLPRPDFLRERAVPCRPCVLAGAMERWPARTWTLEWLRATHGMVRVTVNRSGSREWTPAQTTFGAYIDHIRAAPGAPDVYLASLPLVEHFPALRRDFSFPDYAWLGPISNTLLFVGGGGARSALHVDFCHTLLAQVIGRKRFRLFGPAWTSQLAPRARDLYQSFSGLDPDRIGALPADFDFVLGPGEMLFLPYGWWHGVESLEPSVSVTRSWWTASMVALEPARLLRSRLSTRLNAGGR